MLAASMCPGVVLSLTLCEPVAFPARPPLRRGPADGPRHRRAPAATRRRRTMVARLSRDRRPRCRGSRPAAAPAGARSTGDPRGPPPSVGRRTPGRLARGGTIPQTGDRRRSQRPRQPARPPGPLLGHPRRGRELRHRHLVRVRPSYHRHTGPGRPHLPPGRPRPRGAALLPGQRQAGRAQLPQRRHRPRQRLPRHGQHPIDVDQYPADVHAVTITPRRAAPAQDPRLSHSMPGARAGRPGQPAPLRAGDGAARSGTRAGCPGL